MDLMNFNGDQGDVEPLGQLFTYTLTVPGLPTETLIGSLALLLNVYGISHNLPYVENLDSVITDNPAVDARFHNDYIMLKMFLDGLIKDFQYIQCHAVANYVTVHMTFTCS